MTRSLTSDMCRSLAALTSFTVAGAMVLAGAGLASAEQPATDAASAQSVEESLQNLEEVNPGLLAVPVESETHGLAGSSHSVPIGGGSVEVSSSPAEGVSLRSSEGEALSIQLPHANSAEPVEVLEDGTFAYPGEDSANAVVVTEQGVQMLTTIANEGASSTFAYEIDLSVGETLELVPSGAAVVVDSAGETVLAFGEPWASDAEGKEVETWFEVNGSTLTQVVDHASDEDVTYPVVSDPIVLAPWMVRCLVGIGLKSPDITRIAQLGTPYSILAAFGRGAVACVFMK